MMDTVHLIYNCKTRLTAENSPFHDFSRNERGFPQSVLKGKDYYEKHGFYYPTLKYIERPTGGGKKGVTYEIKIEFSIPKLLCGNNLYEFDESWLDCITETLHKRLLEMGITFISESEIGDLYVRRMDIGKNIPMKNRLEVSGVIRAISMANMKKVLDLDRTDYSNGGYLVRFRSIYEDITFYDKGRDLERSRISNKKSADSDPYMTDGIDMTIDEVNVLRYEIKMYGKKTIVRRMKSVGLVVPEDWQFKNLYKNEVCKRLLQERMNDILKCTPKIPLDTDSVYGLLSNVMTEELAIGKRGGLTRSLARFGLVCALRDGVSFRDISMMAGNAFGKNATSALKNIRGSPASHQLKNLLYAKKVVDEFNMLRPEQE